MSLMMKAISRDKPFLGLQGHPFHVSDCSLDFSNRMSPEQLTLALPTVNSSSSLQNLLFSVYTLTIEGIIRDKVLLSAPSCGSQSCLLLSITITFIHRLLTWPFLSDFYPGSVSPLPDVSIQPTASSSSGIYVAITKNMPCYSGHATSFIQIYVQVSYLLSSTFL